MDDDDDITQDPKDYKRQWDKIKTMQRVRQALKACFVFCDTYLGELKSDLLVDGKPVDRDELLDSFSQREERMES